MLVESAVSSTAVINNNNIVCHNNVFIKCNTD